MKRFLSLILAFAIILSFVPVFVIAEGASGSAGEDPIEVTYDFALENTSLVNNNGASFAKQTLNTAANEGKLASYYTQGELNWKYTLNNASSFKTSTNTSTALPIFGGNGYVWTGLRLINKVVEGSVSSYPTGHWNSFTIRVETAGTYNISLNYQKRSGGAKEGQVYLLPGTYATVDDVDAAMSASTLLGTLDFSNNSSTPTNASAQLGEVELTAGEHTIVFKGVSYATGSKEAYIYISNLKMLQVLDPGDNDAIQPQGYNFALGSTDLTDASGASLAGKTLTQAPIKAAVDGFYADGTTSWKYGLDNIASFATDSKTAHDTFYFGGTDSYKWTGLRLGAKVQEGSSPATYPAGYWVGFTVKSPGAGNFKFDLSYQPRSGGTSAGEVYLVKGEFTDIATLEEKLTKENLRQVVDFSSNTTDFFAPVKADLGIVTMEDCAYTVVFKATKADASAYMHISALNFTQTQDAPYVPTLPGEEEELPVQPQGYNFALGATDLVDENGAALGGKNISLTTTKNALAQYYDQGILSWKYTLDNADSFKTNTNSVVNTSCFGDTDTYKYHGLRFGVKVQEGKETATYPAGFWMALTIQSPGKGTFDANLNFQSRNDSTPAGEVYLIKGTFTDARVLEKKLTEENLLKSVNFQANNTTTQYQPSKRSLGVVAFEQGEYTLVFKAAEMASYGAYMTITDITFTPCAPEVVLPPVQANKIVYDFNLGPTDLVSVDGADLGGQDLENRNVIAALGEYYEKQKIYWKYAASNLSSFKKKDTTILSTCYFSGPEPYHKYNGLRLGVKVNGPKVDPNTNQKVASYPAGWWVAVNIHSPGKGLYYLTLDYQKRADACTEGEFYLIKGALTNASDIQAQLTPENRLLSEDLSNRTLEFRDKKLELGAVCFEQGEYTLVFRAANAKDTGAYMYLNKLTATHESIMTFSDETVYNFALSNVDDGIYTGQPTVAEKETDIAQLYDRGKLNWKYEDREMTLSDTFNNFNKAYDLYLYTNQEQWMAFRIKSPGKGLHTLILNHSQGASGALGAVYVLPGDTKDIQSAMDHGNRVGKVQFYNETGDSQTENGKTTTVGTYEFGDEKEYILVMEAYEASPYKSGIGYMWLTSLIAKKGDHTKQQTATRRIRPMVVDPDPVKGFETTAYGTTAVVNGQDYLFLPTEGKKMFVYNLDNVTLEAIVKTPFTTMRGMTTDSDGIVWGVGDNAYVWRYDPYTEVGTRSINYKIEGGIEDTNSGFTIVSDDNGNLYLGSYEKAYIVKYEPQSGKFSKVVGELHPDAAYSSGLVYKDGFLYAAISGDRNNDGAKVAEVLKIDLAANKVVARKDILPQFGDDEVMVRGSGICGNTLFIGGDVMDAFIAFDIDTMEFKDYGIGDYQMSWSPTEEIDGKCYMLISTLGFHEYDSSTDTLTKVENMEYGIVGFRCRNFSSITLENNPLLPGTSYVTYASTGVKIYNFETQKVFSPDLYDEDNNGSGQDIRTIVNGLPGSDEIYIGGYNTENAVAISLLNGETVKNFKVSSAQTDAFLWYENALYAGTYNNGAITKINLEDENRNVVLQSMKDMYGQSRVHALAAGDGWIFGGTVPDSFMYGGCLIAINLQTQERVVVENIVKDQCITGLVYNDGLVFGTTSLAGGTGTLPGGTNPENSAVIFVYDVQKKEKIAELDLREHIPGLLDTLPYVNGIVADPNVAENGKYWGIISETLFSFTFNKETNTFKVKEELCFTKTVMPATSEARHWFARDFAFKDGYMYASFGSQGGLQKINLENPKDHSRVNCETPTHFVIAEDGNLYYSIGNQMLKMYPLDVTESDWEKSEKVDALIAKIDKKVTLESETAILAASDAYQALSLKHRALVQNFETLEIAQTDLLEAKIETIEEVSLDDKELILSLNETYKALTANQQKYVKNYETLRKATKELQAILDKIEADRVQKILDEGIRALGEITLEDEETIKGLRETFNALTFAQQNLVDTTQLKAVEEAIKELRQVRIDRLIQLIGMIGDVTLEDESIITEAMDIYNWMYLDEREQLDYSTLITAKGDLEKLQKEAAAAVDALIQEIGDSVDYSDKNAIKIARAAYDALTPGSKQYVTMLSLLEEAELLYSHMFPIWAMVVIAVVAVAGAVTAIIVVRKKRKAIMPTVEDTAS